MDPDFQEITRLLQSGGNAALMIAAWILYRGLRQIARIELMLEILLTRGEAIRERRDHDNLTRKELEKLLKERGLDR